MVSIPDNTSLGGSTIETSKHTEESPIDIISDMRREFLSEFQQLKDKESRYKNKITCLRQESGLLRPPLPISSTTQLCLNVTPLTPDPPPINQHPPSPVRAKPEDISSSMISRIEALQTPPNFTITVYNPKDGKN